MYLIFVLAHHQPNLFNSELFSNYGKLLVLSVNLRSYDYCMVTYVIQITMHVAETEKTSLTCLHKVDIIIHNYYTCLLICMCYSYKFYDIPYEIATAWIIRMMNILCECHVKT